MKFSWWLLDDHARYAYHYTRASRAVQILEGGRIRFSPFSGLNDPREFKDWRLGFFSQRGNAMDDADAAMEAALNRYFKHSWRVGCFCSDTYEAVTTRHRELEGGDVVHALYDRGHARPRMWAQYGEDSCGACIVFDRQRLDVAVRGAASRAGQRVFHGAVTYTNPKAVPDLREPGALFVSLDRVHDVGVEAAANEHIAKFWHELFMVKSKDWAQERELRWLVGAGDSEDFFVPIEGACVGIVLGNRAPAWAKHAVSSFVEAREEDVSIAVMEWNNGFPQPMNQHWRLLRSA